jgi:hypothetical protein
MVLGPFIFCIISVNRVIKIASHPFRILIKAVSFKKKKKNTPITNNVPLTGIRMRSVINIFIRQH